MERIDELENMVDKIERQLRETKGESKLAKQEDIGKAQNLKDREILEYLGETNETEDKL